MKKKLTIAAGALAVLAVAAVVAVALVFLFVETASERKEEAHRAGYPHAAANAPRGDERQADGKAEGRGQAEEETDEESGDGESEMVGVEAEEKSEEELQEEEEEKKVDAFDSLTDKWMEKEGGEVTMKDMDRWGLNGCAGASERRRALGQRLGIGFAGAKTFLRRLNHFGVTREEVEAGLKGLPLR